MEDGMLFTKKPYKIDSVYYVDNTLKIGCGCQEYSQSLTGGNAVFKDVGGIRQNEIVLLDD